MAIVLVFLQIALCITLTMAQEPARTYRSVNWLYRPTFVYNPNPRPMMPPLNQRQHQPMTTRNDYTYVPEMGAYKVHTRGVSWNEARTTCDEEGGHLVIFNSVAESEKVAELFKNAGPVTGAIWRDMFYVGIHDFFEEGQFVTLHSQTLAKAGFNLWASNEPNNRDNAEHCGASYDNGKFLDMNCDSPLAFVCELPIGEKYDEQEISLQDLMVYEQQR